MGRSASHLAWGDDMRVKEGELYKVVNNTLTFEGHTMTPGTEFKIAGSVIEYPDGQQLDTGVAPGLMMATLYDVVNDGRAEKVHGNAH